MADANFRRHGDEETNAGLAVMPETKALLGTSSLLSLEARLTAIAESSPRSSRASDRRSSHSADAGARAARREMVSSMSGELRSMLEAGLRRTLQLAARHAGDTGSHYSSLRSQSGAADAARQGTAVRHS